MPMEKSRKDKEKMLRIPLTERLLSILDLKDKKPSDTIYQGFVRNSSDINPMLRFIMKEVGINKYLSFHSTRHTFAVSALTLGMSLETVSDIMGHNDLRTTQIYAKIIDDKRKLEDLTAIDGGYEYVVGVFVRINQNNADLEYYYHGQLFNDND